MNQTPCKKARIFLAKHAKHAKVAKKVQSFGLYLKQKPLPLFFANFARDAFRYGLYFRLVRVREIP